MSTATPDMDGTALSRRRVLTVGGAAAAAAALLAACAPDDSNSGDSGVATTTTEAGEGGPTPTVPGREPTEVEIAGDTQQIQTLISLELSAAASYERVIGDLTDPANVEAAQAFRQQHQETATALQSAATSALDSEASWDEPNEYLDDNVSGPVLDGLESDAENAQGSAEAKEAAESAFVRFLMNTEGTLASTYLSAVGLIVSPELREAIAVYVTPSARRQAVWGRLADLTVPPDALFSVRDAVPNEALIVADTGEATAGQEAGSAGDAPGGEEDGGGEAGTEEGSTEGE